MTNETTAPEPAVQDAPDRMATLRPLIQSITQREKFLLADRLGRPFHELMEDRDRVMIALLWIKRKRDNAGIGPSFDDILDMTDAEIIDALGLASDDDAASEDEGKDD